MDTNHGERTRGRGVLANRAFVLGSLVILVLSCASTGQNARIRLDVTSEPDGAEVLVTQGEAVIARGVAPIKVDRTFDQKETFRWGSASIAIAGAAVALSGTVLTVRNHDFDGVVLVPLGLIAVGLGIVGLSVDHAEPVRIRASRDGYTFEERSVDTGSDLKTVLLQGIPKEDQVIAPKAPPTSAP